MSLMEGSKLIFVEPFVRSFHNMDFCSYYSHINLSEMVELVCLLFTPVYYHSSRTQYWKGEKGRGIRGKQRGGGSNEEEKSVSVRVTIEM